MFLASKLKDWPEVESVQFSRIQNQAYKPILILKPAGKAGKKYTVKIYPMIQDNIFKLSRFEPLKNNIRLSWYNGTKDSKNDFSFPTPLYNGSILSDMLYEKHLEVMYEAVSQCEGLKDAIPLLKVWLSQRNLTEDSSCFNGFQMSMLLAYLLRSKKITPHMSSYQIFRVTLLYLSRCDWTHNGISMAPSSDNNLLPSIADFHAVYDVVFVDPTGYLNLCYNMRMSTFHQLQFQAKLAIESFQDMNINNFDALFMKPSKFEEIFGHWFRIKTFNSHENLCSREDLQLKLVDAGGDWGPVLVDRIIKELQKGLGKRIEGLEMRQQKASVWELASKPPDSTISDVTIGLLINTDHAEDILDMGPPADDPEAVEFRNYWGEKSDLRRFKDGSINEAVVWEGSNKAERRLICKQVVNYLLKRFFDIHPSNVDYFADQLDCLVQPNYVIDYADNSKKNVQSQSYRTSTGEEESLRVIHAFDELSKQMRNLEGLLLDVVSIQGSLPAFRLTDVFPTRILTQNIAKSSEFNIALPSPSNRSPWVPALDVVLQFESTGSWPNDFEAVQNIKSAFYIKLASLLRIKYSLIAKSSNTFLDVIKNGFVFRIRIFNKRDIQLYKNSHTNETAVMKKRLEDNGGHLDIKMVKQPLHTTMIHSLHQRFAAFGMTTRLAKRWISAQMLSDYIIDEAVELIVASLFLMPMPNRFPSSHLNGFLRFLTIIANHDWTNDPLIVDLNGTFTIQDYSDIREHFTKHRKDLPAVFIATPYDKESSIWTKDHFTSKLLSRITLLAKLSRDVLDMELQKSDVNNLKQIFRPPLEDYNVLIELDSNLLPRHYQAVDTSVMLKPPKEKAPTGDVFPVVEFDPAVIYLNELKSTFSDIAWFFHDKFGGTVIGVVWKPNALDPRSFKILGLKYKMPSTYQSKEKATSSSSQQYVEPNIDAIVEDFRIIGRGLVTAIRVQKV